MNNNIDISLTLGTRADMSGINQVRKGVDDLSTAARGLPRELISGGEGTVADARAFSGASAPGKMTIQVEGLDRLAGTIAHAEGVAANGTPAQGRTDKALEEMQSGIARVSKAVEEVARGAAAPDHSPLPVPSAREGGNEWMMARLDQIAALLARMPRWPRAWPHLPSRRGRWTRYARAWMNCPGRSSLFRRFHPEAWGDRRGPCPLIRRHRRQRLMTGL